MSHCSSEVSPTPGEFSDVLVQVPFALVFTKTDKRKKTCPGAAENIAAFQKELLADWQVRCGTAVTLRLCCL